MQKKDLNDNLIESAFELFKDNLYKDKHFFSELRELEISYTTLINLLDEFILNDASQEKVAVYLFAKNNSNICRSYKYFYDNYDLLKGVYDKSAKVNFDGDLLFEVANQMNYSYKYFKRILRAYIYLFATPEEYLFFKSMSKKVIENTPKIEHANWYVIINTILSKELDDAVNYLKNEITISYNGFGNYINIYRVHNPFNLSKDELSKTCAYLYRLQKRCLEPKMVVDKSPIDKTELNKKRLEEIYIKYKGVLEAYVNNKTLVGNLSPKNSLHNYEFDELVKAASIFDKDLYDRYINKSNQEKDLNNISNICLKIAECLEKGVNINGHKDSFSLYDFAIITDINIKTLLYLKNVNLYLNTKQLQNVKEFLFKNSKTRIIVDQEKIISEKISFIHNGEKLTPTIEDKRYVMDYILSKNISYVSAYKVALRRYTKYGVINEEVIPYEEQVKLTLPTDNS